MLLRPLYICNSPCVGIDFRRQNLTLYMSDSDVPALKELRVRYTVRMLPDVIADPEKDQVNHSVARLII